MIFKPEVPMLIPIDRVGEYILNSGYGFQEKYNGKRRTIIKHEDRTAALNKQGVNRSVDDAFVKHVMALPYNSITFEAEQVSKHYHIFDLLTLEDDDLMIRPYDERISIAHDIFSGKALWRSVVSTAIEEDEKLALAKKLIEDKAEGLIIRKLNAKYKPGKSGQHLKIKFEKTLDAVVIGPSPKGHESVEIGLFNPKGQLIRIGGCSQIGKEKVAAGDVIEVKYLYGTRSNHIVQPRMTVRRDDKEPSECLLSQMVINRDMA
jgi:hypothetical protein